MKHTHATRRCSFVVFFLLLFAVACSESPNSGADVEESGIKGIPSLAKHGTAT
jgi:hypothetical protein